MDNGKVRMEFIGQERGAVTIHVNGRPYRGADSSLHKYADADPADVAKLVATGKWRVVRSQASTPAPMVAPPSSPIIPFDWGKAVTKGIADAVSDPRSETPYVEIVRSNPVIVPGLDKMITTGFQEPDPNGQIAVAPAFQDDYAVTNMTISDVKTAIANGTDKMTLLGWLTAEQTSEKPRAGVVSAIEKALA